MMIQSVSGLGKVVLLFFVCILGYFLGISGAVQSQTPSWNLDSRTIYLTARVQEPQLWRVNIDTGEIELAYQVSSGTYLTSIIPGEANGEILGIEIPLDFWLPTIETDFQVIRIDLATGARTSLYTGHNPGSLEYIGIPNHYLLTTWEPPFSRSFPVWNMCLLNVVLQTCQPVHEQAAAFLSRYSSSYWLSTTQILVADRYDSALRQVNTETGQSVSLLNGWVVWAFGKVPGQNAFLLAAQSPTPQPTQSGLYEVSAESFSNPTEVVSGLPAMDMQSIQNFRVSPDNHFAVFLHEYSPRHFVLGDLASQTYQDLSPDVTGVEWLSQDSTLIGFRQERGSDVIALVVLDVASDTWTTVVEQLPSNPHNIVVFDTNR